MIKDTFLHVNISKIIHPKGEGNQEPNEAYQDLKNEVEPSFFSELLKHTHGNKAHAARIAGLDRGTLGVKLKQHGIEIKSLIASKQVQA